MKASQFLAITMAALAFLSCSKEEGAPAQEAGHSNLSIKIVGETEAPKGRAAGEPTEAEESTINNFILYVFKADGKNDITPTAFDKLPTSGKATAVITTDAKEVYVIANTLTPKGDGTFVANATHTQLLAIKNKGELQVVMGRGFTDIDPSLGLPTQTSTNLWMSGKNDLPFTPVKDDDVAATVTMKFIAAKVRITSVTVDPSVTGLTLSQVIVLNGAGATSFIPAEGETSLIPSFTPKAPDSPFYVSGVGMSGSNFSIKPSIVGRNDGYSYPLVEPKTITSATNQHYFYVFENDGEANLPEPHPTIVTLKCLDVDVTPYYYSVFFKADAEGKLGYDNQVIQRGKIYNIAMTIRKLGSSDPTVPAMKTTVTVTITSATWETVTIDKTYE